MHFAIILVPVGIGDLTNFRIFINGWNEETKKNILFSYSVLINCEIRLFCYNFCRCFLGFLPWILRRKLRKKNGLHLSLKRTFNIFALQYFTGNKDQNTIVQYRLFPRIIARYVRIHPWGWYRHICMRVEFYGCRQGLLLFFNQIMFGYANYLVRHKRRNIVSFLRIPDRNKSTENVREKKTKIGFFVKQSYWSREEYVACRLHVRDTWLLSTLMYITVTFFTLLIACKTFEMETAKLEPNYTAGKKRLSFLFRPKKKNILSIRRT